MRYEVYRSLLGMCYDFCLETDTLDRNLIEKIASMTDADYIILDNQAHRQEDLCVSVPSGKITGMDKQEIVFDCKFSRLLEREQIAKREDCIDRFLANYDRVATQASLETKKCFERITQ